MALSGVISNLLFLGAKLLPAVIASAQAASSSSSPAVDQNHQIEPELQKLMRILERIKATLYDAEQREITDSAVKLWLKELKGVVYDAEDVLGEYHYEVLRAQVEARNALPPDSRKRKLIQVPCGMVDQIQRIRGRFDEIVNDRIALQLTEGDGPKWCNSELQISPTSHMVDQSNIFGREGEKEKLINLLSSKCDVVSVVTIVGTGGIGKTTLAQLVYNEKGIQEGFDKIVWICVSQDFNVVRLTKESIESITENECGLTNLSALQKEFQKAISGKRILFVLDDVWNENKSLWDSFQAPFMSAAFVKILVTTRSDNVARIMQTEPTFNLGYLLDEQCWQLFEHYAFGGKEHNKGQKLVEIGKQIMSKCGMLPLAVKSIASLLRHEAEEESWSDILENELWESEARNEIFPPLQISYVRLPTYLKSCFLYCSMFPKDYCYDIEYLVKLWMYQGFIESKGNKSKEKIGFEYAQQLFQRSLFERKGRYEGNDFFRSQFKLHDMVHDLARSNSENGCYSIEVSNLQISPNVVNHLYIADNVNLRDPIDKFTALRTLITSSSVKNLFSAFDHSMPPKLRALDIRGSGDCKLELLSSIGILKHLRYLYISNMFFETLPECICSLYSLQNLTLKHSDFKELPTKIQNLISLEELIIDHCFNLAELPESLCQIKALRKLFIISSCNKIKVLPNNIGNLVNLEELRIVSCDGLQVLPESLCQLKAMRKLDLINCHKLEEVPSGIGSLTKLQTLEISNNGVSYLPPSLSKLVGIQALKVVLKCENIEWLKNFPDLRGTLYLCELNNVPNSMDLKCANLESMVNLEHLILAWNFSCIWNIDGSVFHLSIKSGENIIVDNQSCFSVMDSLRPHPNLIKLQIENYSGITFPEWIGRLCKLKYLYIIVCESLQFLKAESLPLQLEELKISGCRQLISVPGIQKLKSLAKLSINYCENLCSFMDQNLDGGSSLGLTHLASLRILQIKNCFKLQVLGDELLPVDCKIEVYNCPGLKEWCLQHRISYKEDDELKNRRRRGSILTTLAQGGDPRIVSIVFDEKNNVVRVSGSFNPNEHKRTLLARLDGIIKGIDIEDDDQEEMEEEMEDEAKPPPPKPPMYPWLPKPPMYPWPPQVAMVCFVCPCMTAWSNNYQSCSCGVERWPGRCGCRSGSGSRWGSGPRYGDRPQCTCEPSQQRNIGYESMPSIGYELLGYESMSNIGYESTPSIGYESTPSISYESTPTIGYEPTPSIGYESTPGIGYESTPTIGYESTPNIGYESTPTIGYESTEPSCSIM